MKLAIVVVLAIVVGLLGVVVLYGLMSTTTEQKEPPVKVSVKQGWNSFIVPESWIGVTSKTITSKNPLVSAVSYEDSNATWHSYLPRYTDAYIFSVEPGAMVWIYVTADTEISV